MSQRQRDAAVADLVAGLRKEDAGRAAGMSRQTVTRRLADPDFVGRLRDVQADIVRAAVDGLLAEVDASRATLVGIRDSATARTADRLRAAIALADLAARWSERRALEEVDARLATVESAQQAATGNGRRPPALWAR